MICPHCRRRAPATATECPFCGRSLASARAASPAAVRRPAGSPEPTERRPLTVMFCDIVDSVALSQRLDPEDLMGLIERYQTLCDDIVSDRGGFLAKFMGDGVLAYFGYPRADEDDAANAVNSALDIVGAVRELERERQIALEARVGIASGLVVLRGRVSRSRQRTVEVVGRILNLASRLQSTAPPGAVLISDATRKVTRGFFNYRDLGAVSLRGFPEPVRAWQVEESNPAVSRFQARLIGQPTPFVGRRAELKALEACWAKAQRGKGQVVELIGEAGMGKSRLTEEFDRRLGVAAAARVYLQCAPERANSAFRPIALLLERAAGFERRDSPAARLQKLGRILNWPRTPDPTTAAIFSALLGIPQSAPTPLDALTAEKRRELTMEALLALAFTWMNSGPLLVIVEDAHWIDASTLEVIDRMIAATAERPVLTLIAARPEFVSPWRKGERMSVVTLSRLDAESARAVCAHVAAGALPDGLVREAVDRSGGIPFYMEELTRLLVERKSTKDEDPESAEIPISLHDSLVARLDRLGPARRFANIGAIIGRQFSYDLLAAVANAPLAQTRAAMGALKRAGLVGQSGAGETIRYSFRHVLMRDAAYESMLRPERRSLHQQVASALQTKFPELCEAEPETLAHHLSQGAEPAAAIPHWLAAGARAAARGGHSEAIAHYRAALALIGKLPPSVEHLQAELGVLLPLGVSLAAVRGYAADEVRDALTRAREICGMMGDAAQLFPVLHGLSKFWTVRGDQAQAEELIRTCDRIAEETQAPLLRVESDATLVYVLSVTGQFGAEILTRVERAPQIYDANLEACRQNWSEADAKTSALSVAPNVYLRMGDLEAGHNAYLRALDWARGLGRPFDIAHTLCFTASYLVESGDYAQALKESREAIAICESYGFGVWLLSARAYHAMALAGLGEFDAAFELLSATMAEWRRIGCGSLLGLFTRHLALIEMGRGRFAEALALADEAIALDRKHQDHVFLPGAFEARAMILSARPEPDCQAAEQDLRRGIELAQAQGAKGTADALAARLGRLCAKHGAAAG
jgi:class 3 adenylate cyclase/tetratricopeptide (TPR) repeat protein